jgi:hypothetical protein
MVYRLPVICAPFVYALLCGAGLAAILRYLRDTIALKATT